MVNAVYAIDDFPGDALLWRIEWIGGVGYNTSVPSDPQTSICLAQLPAGQTDQGTRENRVILYAKKDPFLSDDAGGQAFDREHAGGGALELVAGKHCQNDVELYLNRRLWPFTALKSVLTQLWCKLWVTKRWLG